MMAGKNQRPPRRAPIGVGAFQRALIRLKPKLGLTCGNRLRQARLGRLRDVDGQGLAEAKSSAVPVISVAMRKRLGPAADESFTATSKGDR